MQLNSELQGNKPSASARNWHSQPKGGLS